MIPSRRPPASELPVPPSAKYAALVRLERAQRESYGAQCRDRALRRELDLVQRLIAAKNAGLICGDVARAAGLKSDVPKEAGVWCSNGKYWFGLYLGLKFNWRPMGLEEIEALLR